MDFVRANNTDLYVTTRGLPYGKIAYCVSVDSGWHVDVADFVTTLYEQGFEETEVLERSLDTIVVSQDREVLLYLDLEELDTSSFLGSNSTFFFWSISKREPIGTQQGMLVSGVTPDGFALMPVLCRLYEGISEVKEVKPAEMQLAVTEVLKFREALENAARGGAFLQRKV